MENMKCWNFNIKFVNFVNNGLLSNNIDLYFRRLIFIHQANWSASLSVRGH